MWCVQCVRWVGSVLLAAVAGVTCAASTDKFSPPGEFRSVRQVAVRCSDDVVKFSDPKAATPFTIECSAAGHVDASRKLTIKLG